MKSAKVGSAALSTVVASWQQNNSATSQIPLPLRRGSTKSDKGQEYDSQDVSEFGSKIGARRSYSEKSSKSSILSSSSFCCASGQKEDVIPDNKPRLAKKKIAKSPVKKCQNDPDVTPTKKSIPFPKHRVTAKGKNGVSEEKTNEVEQGQSVSRLRSVLPSERSPRANNRFSGKKRSSPERTSSAGREQDKDYTDVMRKLRKDRAHFTPNNLTSSNTESNKLYAKVENVSKAENANGIEAVSEQPTPLKLNANKLEHQEDSERETDAVFKSCDTEDLDCPCCDSVDAKSSDCVVHLCKTDSSVCEESTSSVCARRDIATDVNGLRDMDLEVEVEKLHQELKVEKQKLLSKESFVIKLQQETQKKIEDLKVELAKERELRRSVEGELLLLKDDCDVRKNSAQENEAEFQNDVTPLEDNTLENGLPRSGGDSYVEKLEQDNLMLVKELNKLKDLSPSNQEDQVKLLLTKLDQLEAHKQQQKLEYETCLDEVANKLVHTLLVQKNIEEDCRNLRQRLEQLETLNTQLLEIINLHDASKTHKNCYELSALISSGHTTRCAGLSPECSKLSTIDRIEACRNDCELNALQQKIKSSLPYDKQNGASRIPSIHSPKSSPTRKRTKSELAFKSQDRQKHPSPSHLQKHPSSKSKSNSSNVSTGPKCSSLETSPQKRSNFNSIEFTNGITLCNVKRKRDLNVENMKFRSESENVRWDNISDSPRYLPTSLAKDLPALPETAIIESSDLPTGEIWNYNCSIDLPNPSTVSPGAAQDWRRDKYVENGASLETMKFHKTLEEIGLKLMSPVQENDCSVSTVATHRTRDEGYSTMSSDQQQDSVADTTVSEPEEPSSTYVPRVTSLRLISDDSVTDFLDCSMTSSSDSGFGPLQQIAASSQKCSIPESVDSIPRSDTPSVKQDPRIISTVSTYVKDYSDKNIQSVFPQQPSVDSIDFNNCGAYTNSSYSGALTSQPSTRHYSTIYFSTDETQPELSCTVVPANYTLHKFSELQNHSSSVVAKHTESSETNTSDIGEAIDHSKDLSVETAEKATLTEPEESLWREKALAHFIDESIWSLYSSESDTQLRFVSADTETEFSPLDFITHGEETYTQNSIRCDVRSQNAIKDSARIEKSFEASIEELRLLDNVRHCNGIRMLERAASDSLLYLKDAVHELEDSMKPGLKASRTFAAKHYPLLHRFSVSDISCAENPVADTKGNTCPEILLSLERTMMQNNFISPCSINPSHTSSVCSLPSSNSHPISEEMEDVEALRHQSRKGSEDPDLSSASDMEYENLAHKEFVEKWIQKGISDITALTEKETPQQNPPHREDNKNLSFLKSQDKQVLNTSSPKNFQKQTGNSTLANPAPCQIESSTHCTECISSASVSSLVYPIIFTCENIEEETEPNANMDEIGLELQLLDSEVKEFNCDFYRLCDVGSTNSIDRSLPAILERIENVVDSRIQLHPDNNSNGNCSIGCPRKDCHTQQNDNKPCDKIAEGSAAFIKPIRPVTLSICDSFNPINFHRFQKKDFGSLQPQVTNRNLGPNSNCKIPRSPFKSKQMQFKRPSSLSHNSDAALPSKPNYSHKRSDSIHVRSSYGQAPSLPHNQNLPSHRRCNELNQNQSNYNPEVGGCRSRISPKRSYPPNANERKKVPGRQVTSPKHLSKEARRTQWRRDRQSAKVNGNKEGYGTAWIHLQADADLYDPKTFARLLDSMAESVSSSGSSSEEERDLPVVQSNSHLHKICREKRKRIKASRADDLVAMSPRHRITVINRNSLYYRFGDREKEAIACFDFLENIPTSSNEYVSPETLSKRTTPPNELDTTLKGNCSSKERVNLVSPCASEAGSSSIRSRTSSFGSRLKVPVLWNQPISHNMSSSTLNSQDYELLDHLSLSDSCAESYTSTPESFEGTV